MVHRRRWVHSCAMHWHWLPIIPAAVFQVDLILKRLLVSCFTNIFALPQTEIMANFHVGEVVTSLQKATLIPGGSESLVYTTLSGGIGMLLPFTSHEASHSHLAPSTAYEMCGDWPGDQKKRRITTCFCWKSDYVVTTQLLSRLCRCQPY